MEASTNILFITGFVCTMGGIGLGVVLTLWRSPGARKYRDLEQRLDSQRQETETYQFKVTEHFSQTAGLLGDLTNSYRDLHNRYREVHNHLAQGAQNLCANDTQSSPILEKLTTLLDETETNDLAANTINIPPDDLKKVELQSQKPQEQVSPNSVQTSSEETTIEETSKAKEPELESEAC